MTLEITRSSICGVFSKPRIGGYRISRLEEKILGSFCLDSPTAWQLGTDNIGVFVGGMPALGRTIEKLQGLEDPVDGAPNWVVIAASKAMAAVVTERWIRGGAGYVNQQTLSLPQTRNNIWLCTPESLKRLALPKCHNVAGILLIDSLCHVHKLRGMNNGGFHVPNDRPQHIVNLRSSLCVDGWAPPLFILTEKPAKSVWTDTVARVYCLDAFWFVDGKSLFCGDREPAVVPD